jgi:hypothetical protein
MLDGMMAGFLCKMMEASADLGDPLLQSAVLYFGLGDVHLDKQMFSVFGMLVASLIEELV